MTIHENDNFSYNPHIPNVDALNSDTHTLRIQYGFTQKQCLVVAIESMDIWYMSLTRWLHTREIPCLISIKDFFGNFSNGWFSFKFKHFSLCAHNLIWLARYNSDAFGVSQVSSRNNQKLFEKYLVKREHVSSNQSADIFENDSDESISSLLEDRIGPGMEESAIFTIRLNHSKLKYDLYWWHDVKDNYVFGIAVIL